MEEHHLNSEKLAELTDGADYAKQLGVPQVIQVSESGYNSIHFISGLSR